MAERSPTLDHVPRVHARQRLVRPGQREQQVLHSRAPHHTNSGIAKEVHGNFTGLIMADGFVRNNGTSHIVGMVQLFSPTASTAGNVFGNGNAEIDFSSAALADLPGIGNAPSPAKVISYRRVQ